jgi:hypothetical protein
LKLRRSLQRATILPSALETTKTPKLIGAGRSGRQKIEKRTCFGGPCFEGTLQKPTGVSESSPVAGTIENSAFSENLDAGRTREIQTNAIHKTTGCHTSALGELFIPDESEKLQAAI